MLIALRFRNFRSFRAEAELSCVAHQADKVMRSSLLSLPASSANTAALLPALAIYGANASGKSNVLRTLEYMQQCVALSHSKWQPGRGTHLPNVSSQNEDEPSDFEVEIVAEDTRYRYGFSTDGKIFRGEWLYSYPHARERMLFERETLEIDGAYQTSVKFGDSFGGGERYLSSIEKKVREDSLFISAAAQDNHECARQILYWFALHLVVMPFHIDLDQWTTQNTCEAALKDPEFRRLLIMLLKDADPAIQDVEIVERSSEQVAAFVDRMPENMKDMLREANRYDIKFRVSIGNSVIELPFRHESKGVQKLFAIAESVLSALHQGRLLVIDELETSIHPHMARKIVDWFQASRAGDKNSQIIFTTHDTNLLDQSLLRRDQIWFVERDDLGSHLYSLLDFKPRKDEDLERGYLRGRYGAIPALRAVGDWLPKIGSNHDSQS